MLGMISLSNHKGSRFLNSQYNDGKIFDGFVVFMAHLLAKAVSGSTKL